MNGFAVRPVVFNVITILAMVLALYWTLTYPPEGFRPLLEEVAAENPGQVDEALLDTLQAGEDAREQGFNLGVIVMVIAIISNIAANYLGRQRQQENAARVAELEAQLARRQ